MLAQSWAPLSKHPVKPRAVMMNAALLPDVSSWLTGVQNSSLCPKQLCQVLAGAGARAGARRTCPQPAATADFCPAEPRLGRDRSWGPSLAPATRPRAHRVDASAGGCPGSIIPLPQTADQSCTSAQQSFVSL